MTPTRKAMVGALAIATAVGACGGGSPAAPGYTPGVTASDASSDDGSFDASPADAGPFANCGTSPTSGSLPEDVSAVLMDKCQACHTNPPKNDAPFPLVAYADVHAMFSATMPVYQEMHVVIQADGVPHMPYQQAPALTADQFSTLDDWLLACAPPGE